MRAARHRPAACEPEMRLAEMACRRCGVLGASIVGFPRAEGEALLSWCGPEHARLEGWPFLASEAAQPASPPPPRESWVGQVCGEGGWRMRKPESAQVVSLREVRIAREAGRAVAKRRPTGAQLYRRMLADPEILYRLSDTEIVPFGGELVLEALAELVAGSADGATLRLSSFPMPRGLERRLMLTLKKVGKTAEQKIGQLLAALVMAGLVEMTPNEVRLRMPPWTAPTANGTPP